MGGRSTFGTATISAGKSSWFAFQRGEAVPAAGNAMTPRVIRHAGKRRVLCRAVIDRTGCRRIGSAQCATSRSDLEHAVVAGFPSHRSRNAQCRCIGSFVMGEVERHTAVQRHLGILKWRFNCALGAGRPERGRGEEAFLTSSGRMTMGHG
jgi:hypothetical protein